MKWYFVNGKNVLTSVSLSACCNLYVWRMLQDGFVWNILVFPEMLVGPKWKMPDHTDTKAVEQLQLNQKAGKYIDLSNHKRDTAKRCIRQIPNWNMLAAWAMTGTKFLKTLMPH